MSLALFDLDNTLLTGDSDHAWGTYLAETGIVDAELHRKAQNEFYAQYQAGTLNIGVFLKFQLTPLKENRMEDLLTWRKAFIEEKIRPLIKQERIDLVEHHRQRGDTLVIITATNSFVTRPIADLFNIETLIATEPEKNQHGYTGNVDGEPCFQAGKIVRLRAWLASNGHDYSNSMANSWFYSDSYNDLPLLENATNPVCVTPDERLRAHAENNNWPIID